METPPQISLEPPIDRLYIETLKKIEPFLFLPNVTGNSSGQSKKKIHDEISTGDYKFQPSAAKLSSIFTELQISMIKIVVSVNRSKRHDSNESTIHSRCDN